jgi:hypothetical protein
MLDDKTYLFVLLFHVLDKTWFLPIVGWIANIFLLNFSVIIGLIEWIVLA